MTTRRDFLRNAGTLALGSAVVGRMAPASAQELRNLPPIDRTSTSRGTVVTPNGRSLPWRMHQGWKEFHLVAEEVDHAFSDATRATCWGYNGTTPGPTLEFVEGDRVRIFVTNHLPEHTTIHWHGILLPSGMDGVGGLTQPHIQPGETYVYEFEVRQHGTHMYHPHADEMVQMAFGMMGMIVIHPRGEDPAPVDRDFAIMLHNWALHPGTWRPDPAVMVEFDLWTFNSRIFPAIDFLVARSGERVRIRLGNLSMWNHPIHLHGHQFVVTGSDGGRWRPEQWRPDTTVIVGVGQCRDIEFDAVPGDWALHCHMSHHTMGPMGHDIPNTVGVAQGDIEKRVRGLLPGYMAMGETGMAEHAAHVARGGAHQGHQAMPGPPNTAPMMAGEGPYGPIEMGGMFTVVKVRDDWDGSSDPGWYQAPAGTVARQVGQEDAPAAPDHEHHGHG